MSTERYVTFEGYRWLVAKVYGDGKIMLFRPEPGGHGGHYHMVDPDSVEECE